MLNLQAFLFKISALCRFSASRSARPITVSRHEIGTEFFLVQDSVLISRYKTGIQSHSIFTFKTVLSIILRYRKSIRGLY